LCKKKKKKGFKQEVRLELVFVPDGLYIYNLKQQFFPHLNSRETTNKKLLPEMQSQKSW